MKNILIIDDDIDFRSMLKKLLEKNHYQVFEARDGLEGMRTLNSQQVDLVVTDIIMPDMDGIETIMKLRTDFPKTRVIAISGGGRIGPTDYLNAARALGATHVLSKPFPNEEFLEHVAELLNEQ